MTIAPERPDGETVTTPESENLAALRAALLDPDQRNDWPEIQAAIDYLIGDTFVRDLAA